MGPDIVRTNSSRSLAESSWTVVLFPPLRFNRQKQKKSLMTEIETVKSLLKTDNENKRLMVLLRFKTVFPNIFVDNTFFQKKKKN